MDGGRVALWKIRFSCFPARKNHGPSEELEAVAVTLLKRDLFCPLNLPFSSLLPALLLNYSIFLSFQVLTLLRL